MVRDCEFIYSPIVHDRAGGTIKLLDEEEGGGNWQLSFFYPSSGKVLIKKFSTSLHLFWGQRVDLGSDRFRGIIHKLDGMIPWTFRRESIKAFLREYFHVFGITFG